VIVERGLFQIILGAHRMHLHGYVEGTRSVTLRTMAEQA
jgi:hypothetical protein